MRALEIENKFGIGGEVKISGDFGDGSGVKQSGTVDIEVIDSFGGWVKSGGLESRGDKITNAAIRDEDIAARFDWSGEDRTIGGEFEVGMADSGSQA